MKNTYFGAFIPSLPLGTKPSKLINNNRSSIQTCRIKKINRLLNQSNVLSVTFMSNGLSNDFKGVISTTLLQELEKEQEKVKNPFESLSPLNKRIISILIVVSSALSGWVLTPSRSKWISLGVSFLAGSLSFLALKKFNTTNSFNVQEKLIKVFSSYSGDGNSENELSIIRKEFNISSNEMRTEIMKLYKKLLGFFLREANVNLEEIEELIKFRSFFNVSPQDIGECHYEFAQDLYKDYIVTMERKGSEESNTTVNKFFFLSDRLFALDTKKGYQYESSRLRKVFIFPQEIIEKTCKELSLNIYEKIIISFLEQKFFQNEKLLEIQKTLGVEKDEEERIHLNFYKNKIQEILKTEKIFSSEEKEIVSNIQSLLNISEKNSKQIFSDLTGPLFCSEVISVLEKISSTDEEGSYQSLANNLLDRKNSLLLPSEVLVEVFTQGVKKTGKDFVTQILNSLRFQKNGELVLQVEKLLNLSEKSKKIFDLIDSENQNKFSVAISETLGNLGEQFPPKDLNQLYKTYLETILMEQPSFEVTPEKEKKWNDLSKILSLSKKETSENYRLVTTPVFQKKIKESLLTGKLDQKQKDEIENLEISLKLEKNTCSIIKTSAYRECLEEIMENQKILKSEDLLKLNEIRIFLSLKWENVQSIHDITSEPIFKKSVLEAMGATGIIPSNYWEGLEKLRKRLLLTEQKAKEIFYQCVKEKLKIIFEKAVTDNKKRNTPQNSESKDSGDDPSVKQGAGTALGIEAGDSSGNQLFNLIDLYFRNKIFIENEQVFPENKMSVLKGLSGRSEILISSRSKLDFSYPVTLRGQFEEKTITEMYRQYLVDCFSAKLQSEKRRLFNNLDKLGPILGLSPIQINSIHSGVGVVIYQKYLSQALSKGFLDQSDNAFLSNIQATLSMDSGKCSEIVREGKRSVVNFRVEQIFASPNVNPDRVSEMRKLAIQFGIDLKEDLGVSQEQRSKMFRVEIDSGIEKGKITNESQELIQEIQTSFGLDDSVSKKILLDCITTRCEGHLVNAIASLRRKVDKEVINEMEKMLSFGNLLPIKIQSSIGSNSEKTQLLDLFQSYSSELNTSGKFKEKLELLKLMLDL
mmetsp:Transcript_88906/g.133294  ORF Transcript_88906/g.133294 Transcript_88906/m.133294 type:complete len:1093 (-) Transcript_88906:1536-4814(-)